MSGCKIFLVPGFFGFSELGGLNYFFRVGETLSRALEQRGVDAEVVECRTQPTGSIPRRADRLLDEVIDGGGLEAESIHFIGHSTGGLDVRMLLTPGVRLRKGDEEERLGARTRSAISVATPHFGTPLASIFTSLQGRNLLRFLTVMATSSQGRYTIFAAAQLTSLLAQLDDNLGRKDTLLDTLSERLLDRVSLRSDDPFFAYLQEISGDQGAIIHLTPEGMNLYNAAVADRPTVRYGAVVSAAPPPGLKGAMRSLTAINRATTYAVFTVLHTLVGREHRHYPYPSPAVQLGVELQQRLPFTVDSTTNDGVVPTLSQLYGELVHVCVADHLDIVGQFRGAGGDPHADWLASGSSFDEARFVGAWDAIAQVIAEGERAR
jgi:triacylglycerol lipase